jgi:glycosyltransferase involved in cell wall biosynthesis
VATISATVITYNEEADIAECLRSLGWADEIIVVDSCSPDRTVEIAKRYTQHVYVRPWPGFSEQKNFAVGMATGDWVLHIDADERVTEQLREEIIQTINSPNACDGYHIPRVNHWLGHPIRHSGWYPDYVLRLFRKGKATCVGVSHETFVVDGAEGRLQNPLIHYSYRSVQEHAERAILRSAPLDVQELVQNGGKLYWFLPRSVVKSIFTQIAKGPRNALAFRMLYKKQIKNRIEIIWMLPMWPLVRFIDRFIIRQGFRDGMYGFWIAALSAVYEIVRCALLWEHFIVRHGQGTILPRTQSVDSASVVPKQPTKPQAMSGFENNQDMS